MPESPGAPSPQIRVKVTLMADLRRYVPPGGSGCRSYVLEESATLADVLEAAGIPPGEQVTLSVNNELAEPGTGLRDGDDVVVFSPMEGG
jgi:sulfur carrier protein ThiS